MSLVYTFVSVIPQEFVYRSFFFKRYQGLTSSYIIFAAISAVTFSFAHFFLNNTLVFILTFFGGILFTSSYKKHGSLWLVSAEHSAYGVWLFTIGLGDMLAFPGGPQ
ncbi:CPBP family intramembrane metalloprotease [Alteromonas sp. 5E99-2]|uniref:CPBP family intramembrane glutamic endopeptidase n=1 Tax=Alteromonas sp. 5E99-2 TaxID=2817683 RepID=UPI001A9990B0|nr:CPBP family intramembrane glutamic endopeptidase [Alteromonas sp. 5E99-2]MBO1256000.1 CPBP family intramembrane metalloprotease [Alteromonas sp. 5E99-2]